MSTLDTLFDQYVCASFDKQLYLNAMLGDKYEYALDVHNARLSFRKHGENQTVEKSYAVSVLGTQFLENNQFIWGWVLKEDGLPIVPDNLSKAANDLRSYGESNDVAEFKQPALLLGGLGADFLCAIASGILEANAYFRCKVGQLATLLVIKDPEFPLASADPYERIKMVVPLCLSAFPVQSHKTAIAKYLTFLGLEYAADNGTITATTPDKQKIILRFDEAGKFASLDPPPS